MAIDGQYKLILYPTIRKVLLFDLHADPSEKTDLSERPDMQPVIKTVFRKFLALQKQTGDTLDVASIYPAIQ